MVKYSDSERHIISIFKPGTVFRYLDKEYKVEISGKPTTSRGEPKTDIYVGSLGVINNEKLEFKISFKQENADFLENKMTKERAEQIFGGNWEVRVRNLTTKIKGKFEKRPFIFKEKFRKTQAGSITLGWKFELLNKMGGDLSEIANLSSEEVLEVYSGRKLGDEKRHAKVNGIIIEESGVADCIINCEALSINTAQEAIDNIISIEEFAYSNPNVYFACKALNYRSFNKKHDGNRPLSVFINWSIENSKLNPKVVFNNPLNVKGNQVKIQLLECLNQLNIQDTRDINENNMTSMDNVI